MKNLTLLTLVLAAAFFCASCEENLLTTDVETTLSTTLTANVQEIGLKSTSFPFSETDTIFLADEEDLQEYIDQIKSIDVSKISYALSGIPQGEAITELTIQLPQANFALTLSNLTENYIESTLSIDESKLTSLEQLIDENKMLIIGIEGKSSYAPMKLNVSFYFETTITASLLK